MTCLFGGRDLDRSLTASPGRLRRLGPAARLPSASLRPPSDAALWTSGGPSRRCCGYSVACGSSWGAKVPTFLRNPLSGGASRAGKPLRRVAALPLKRLARPLRWWDLGPGTPSPTHTKGGRPQAARCPLGMRGSPCQGFTLDPRGRLPSTRGDERPQPRRLRGPFLRCAQSDWGRFASGSAPLVGVAEAGRTARGRPGRRAGSGVSFPVLAGKPRR